MSNTPGKAKAPGSPKAPGTLTQAIGYTGKPADTDPYLRGRRDAIAELRASGGVPQSVVGIQVMYCLPDAFVLSYEQLWDAATSGSVGSVMGGKNATGRAAGKKNGIVLGSESGAQAQGGGKKWRNPTDLLGSQRALTLKTAVDKALSDLAERTLRELQALAKASSGDNQIGRSSAVGTTPKCKGSGCGRFLQSDWRFCPKCGTATRG